MDARLAAMGGDGVALNAHAASPEGGRGRVIDDAAEIGVSPALSACAGIVRREARNFFFGLRLTPEPRRSALYAVYAWMRNADDVVDEAGMPVERRRERLAALRAVTRRLIDGRRERGVPEEMARDGALIARRIESSLGVSSGVDPAVWTGLGWVLDQYAVDSADLLMLLDALEADLECDSEFHASRERGSPGTSFGTRDDLREYCDGVASTAGRLCVAVWGLREGVDADRARELATLRGLAFQLTNILRDYAADYDGYRVYLAGDDFARCGLTPAALRHWTEPSACAAMVGEYVAWAESAYADSAELESLISGDCVSTLRTMTRIYRALLRRIGSDPSGVSRRTPVSVPAWRKSAIALGAMASRLGMLRG